MFRKCPRCKEEKTEEDYYENHNAGSYKRTYCKECMKAYNKERYAKQKLRSKNSWF